MQQKDMEALLRQFSQQSGDATAAARLKANMQAPQNQRAAQTILKQHGASLEQAMQRMQAGDTEGAKQIIQRTMQTPEGAQLAQQIARLMGR
jgi:uncharacterized protein YdaU (DUF1376 family)